MVIGDVLSMIPFLIPAYIVNDMYLSGAFILMTITGLLHHYFIESNWLLIFDFVAILTASIVLMSKTKLTEGVKKTILFLKVSIIVLYITLGIIKTRLPWRINLIIMSIGLAPFLVFLIPFLSNISKILLVILIINYMITSCTCNSKYELLHITWGTFHLFFVLTAYFALNDLKLIKPKFSIKRHL